MQSCIQSQFDIRKQYRRGMLLCWIFSFLSIKRHWIKKTWFPAVNRAYWVLTHPIIPCTPSHPDATNRSADRRIHKNACKYILPAHITSHWHAYIKCQNTLFSRHHQSGFAAHLTFLPSLMNIHFPEILYCHIFRFDFLHRIIIYKRELHLIEGIRPDCTHSHKTATSIGNSALIHSFVSILYTPFSFSGYLYIAYATLKWTTTTTKRV